MIQLVAFTWAQSDLKSLLGHLVYMSCRQQFDFINLESYSPEKESTYGRVGL